MFPEVIAPWYRHQLAAVTTTQPDVWEVEGGAWIVGRPAGNFGILRADSSPMVQAEGPPSKKTKGDGDREPCVATAVLRWQLAEEPGLLACSSTLPSKLPHLEVAVRGHRPEFNYVRLSTRVDLDRLFAAMHKCELFSHVVQAGARPEWGA